MSYPNGVRKEVWVFVFDKQPPNSPFINTDRRVKLLKGLKAEKNVTPDFVAEGSMSSCGREIVRKLIGLGFLKLGDMVRLTLGIDLSAFGELADGGIVKKIDEQKAGESKSVSL